MPMLLVQGPPFPPPCFQPEQAVHSCPQSHEGGFSFPFVLLFEQWAWKRMINVQAKPEVLSIKVTFVCLGNVSSKWDKLVIVRSLWPQREKAHQWRGQDSRSWHWGVSPPKFHRRVHCVLRSAWDSDSGSLRCGACDVFLQVICHSPWGSHPSLLLSFPWRTGLTCTYGTVPSVQFSWVQSLKEFTSDSLWLHECSMPGLPVHHQLLEFTQTHVHGVSDVIQPSHPLSSPSPPALNLSQHQGLFKSVSSLHHMAKVLEFSFNISPSNEHSGLISFRMDWLDCLAVQGTLKSLLQYHASKASILWCSAFFIVQLSHPYMTTGKTIALTRRTFVGKVMSLLFNMLSRLVVTFLPRSKHLLMSWLQSPSAVILEPKNKVWHCFPICLPWSDGTRCHDLSFLNVEL